MCLTPSALVHTMGNPGAAKLDCPDACLSHIARWAQQPHSNGPILVPPYNLSGKDEMQITYLKAQLLNYEAIIHPASSPTTNGRVGFLEARARYNYF